MQVKGVTDKTPYSQQAVRRDHTEEVIFEQGPEGSEEESHADIRLGTTNAKARR